MNTGRLTQTTLLAICIFCLPMLSTAGAEMTGRQIMEKQEELHEAKDEEFRQDMLLIDRHGNTRKRDVVNYFLKKSNGLNKTVIIFLAPADVRKTGLLTWEQKDRDDDQWLYLPAMRKAKRIASSGKKNKFMGTDFAYEDLRPEDLDAHTYNLIGSEKIAGQDCYVVEALPATKKEKRESGYSKKKFWVRKDIFFTIKKEFYNKQGQLEKESMDEDLEKISGSMWRSKKVTMKDLKAKHQTVLITTSRKINKGVPERKFTLRELKK
ncbi:MAG: outer membrane lipoprotein-sorting protein [Candidatus Binatia bacterium]